MAGPTVVVSVLADSKPFKSAMDDIGGSANRMGGLLKAGIGIAAGALAGLSVAAVKAVGDASSLEQSVGGVASVFGVIYVLFIIFNTVITYAFINLRLRL